MVKLAEVHNCRLPKDRPVPEIRKSMISFEKQLQLIDKKNNLNAYYKVDHRSLGSNVPRRVHARDRYLNLIVIFFIAL